MNDLHTRNGGHRVRPGASIRLAHSDTEDAEDVLVTPGEFATWAAVLALLAFLSVVLLAVAAFHLIARFNLLT